MTRPVTTLSMFYFNAGLADGECVEQFTQAWDAFIEREGDPGWGDVVIAAGMHGVMAPRKGDLNLYWWWSGSDNPDWLEHYCDKATVRPAAILCTSRKMERHARARGFQAIYLPVATGPDYHPLPPRPRSGTCYCGTPGHKDREQEACMIAPARMRGDFQWWTVVDGGRPELNERYAGRAVCLGMTATITESWGIVPQRTYEVLAGDNPYLTYRHWAMKDELGAAYPFQSSSPDETSEWLAELIDHADRYRAIFAYYGELVRERHTWDKRMEMLREGLAGL